MTTDATACGAAFKVPNNLLPPPDGQWEEMDWRVTNEVFVVGRNGWRFRVPLVAWDARFRMAIYARGMVRILATFATINARVSARVVTSGDGQIVVEAYTNNDKRENVLACMGEELGAAVDDWLADDEANHERRVAALRSLTNDGDGA